MSMNNHWITLNHGHRARLLDKPDTDLRRTTMTTTIGCPEQVQTFAYAPSRPCGRPIKHESGLCGIHHQARIKRELAEERYQKSRAAEEKQRRVYTAKQAVIEAARALQKTRSTEALVALEAAVEALETVEAS
jgi:hypothetical protein